MKTIKNSKANIIGFLSYILLSIILIAAKISDNLKTNESVYDIMSYAAMLIIGGIFIFFHWCTGKLLYDETHLEYISFIGKKKFSIEYKDIKEIDYHIKYREYKYIFKLNNNEIYKMKALDSPENIVDLISAMKKQNQNLKIYSTSSSGFSEELFT